MPSTAIPSLPSLLSNMERVGGLEHQLFKATSQLRDNDRLSKSRLAECIERMCTLADTAPRLWRHAAELVHHAALNCDQLGISPAQCIVWIDTISSRSSCHKDVQHCLSALIRNNHVVSPRTVHKWIESALWHRSDKPAALMMLSHPLYHHWSNLKTRVLCDWLDRAASDYQGNHGVFRFFGTLVQRLKYVNEGSAALPIAIESLANALYTVSKADFFYEDVLLAWADRLRPIVRTEVRKQYEVLLRRDISSLLKKRKAFTTSAPATS